MKTELMEMIKDIVIKNNNASNTYVIDEIQMLILRETNEFLTYMECEEIYNSII
jgi:hypothetical protein